MINLSVIIPVYNAEKYLGRCIESVLCQVSDDAEILLIDDGSTDQSPTICDAYAFRDKRVRVFHKKNAGVSEARNTGIDEAKGTYIFFMDSDDYISDGYFEKILPSEVDLVVTNYVAFWEDNNRQLSGKFDTILYNSRKAFLEDFHLYFATVFNFPWGKLYKRGIIQKNRIRFRKDIAVSEDVIFNVEYYNLCDTFFVCADAKVMYRQRNNSLSHSFYEHLINWYELSYQEIYNSLIGANAFSKMNEKHFYTCFQGNVMECIDIEAFKDERVMDTFVRALKDSMFVKKSMNYGRLWERMVFCFGISINTEQSIKKSLRVYISFMKIRGIIKKFVGRK